MKEGLHYCSEDASMVEYVCEFGIRRGRLPVEGHQSTGRATAIQGAFAQCSVSTRRKARSWAARIQEGSKWLSRRPTIRPTKRPTKNVRRL